MKTGDKFGFQGFGRDFIEAYAAGCDDASFITDKACNVEFPILENLWQGLMVKARVELGESRNEGHRQHLGEKDPESFLVELVRILSILGYLVP